jgi:tetratricopeptide (TPR) repeat protein
LELGVKGGYCPAAKAATNTTAGPKRYPNFMAHLLPTDRPLLYYASPVAFPGIRFVLTSRAFEEEPALLGIAVRTLPGNLFLIGGLAFLVLPLPGRAFEAAQAASSGQANPAPEEGVFKKIDALIGAKECEKAEGLLRGELAKSVPPALAYFRMGRLYLDHDEWARAASSLEKSIQAQEANDQAHLLLGLAYRELKKPAQAEEEFARAAALNPASSVNAYFAGQQLLMGMKYEAALPYLYTAVRLDPGNASAYRALGMAQVHLGNYGLAESYYRKAVDALGDSDSAEPGPFLDLAFILLLGHDPAKVEEALKLAERAAKLQPHSGSAHYLVGKALMKMGRVKEAAPELEKATKLDPEDSKAHFQLALAYDQLGEKEKASAERRALAQTKQRANQQGMASGSVMPQAVQ